MNIYFILCLLWGLYASYKQRTIYQRPLNCWKNVIITGLINFWVFPYALYIAIKNKKI